MDGDSRGGSVPRWFLPTEARQALLEPLERGLRCGGEYARRTPSQAFVPAYPAVLAGRPPGWIAFAPVDEATPASCSCPRRRMVLAALRSAFSWWPQATHLNTAWLCGSLRPRGRRRCTSGSCTPVAPPPASRPTMRPLYSSIARAIDQPLRRMARFRPALARTRLPGASTVPAAEAVMFFTARSSMAMSALQRTSSVVRWCRKSLRIAAMRLWQAPSLTTAFLRLAEPFFLRETACCSRFMRRSYRPIRGGSSIGAPALGMIVVAAPSPGRPKSSQPARRPRPRARSAARRSSGRAPGAGSRS